MVKSVKLRDAVRRPQPWQGTAFNQVPDVEHVFVANGSGGVILGQA